MDNGANPQRTGRQPWTAMVVFSYYPQDPRVRREAEALTGHGFRVEVFCLRGEGQTRRETVDGVDVIRLPLTRKRGSKVRYIMEYVLFFLAAAASVTMRHVFRRYRIVHAHNMPDFLIFTGIIPWLTGAKLILDLHDPMPEVYMTKYDLGPDHWMIRLLKRIERMSIRFADHVLTPNRAFERLFISRGCPPEKITIVMNSPDEKLFHRRQTVSPGHNDNGKIKLIYHGTVVKRHGLENLLGAVARLKQANHDVTLTVCGEGDYTEEMLERVTVLGIEDNVRYLGFQPHEVIVDEIDRAHIGVIPNISSPFTDINMPTRIFEYIARGKPVAVPRTTGISDYFDETALFFIEPPEEEVIAQTVEFIAKNPGESVNRHRNAHLIYQGFLWSKERGKLVSLVKTLAGNGSQAPEGVSPQVEVK